MEISLCPLCMDDVPTKPGQRAGGDGSHRMCLARGFDRQLFKSVEEWEEQAKRLGAKHLAAAAKKRSADTPRTACKQ